MILQNRFPNLERPSWEWGLFSRCSQRFRRKNRTNMHVAYLSRGPYGAFSAQGQLCATSLRHFCTDYKAQLALSYCSLTLF